jgi:hypothetical protein
VKIPLGGAIKMNPKDVRKQLRNVVKELIGEILSSEIGEQLRRENAERLAKLEQGQKDIMSFLIRSTTPSTDKAIK